MGKTTASNQFAETGGRDEDWTDDEAELVVGEDGVLVQETVRQNIPLPDNTFS